MAKPGFQSRKSGSRSHTLNHYPWIDSKWKRNEDELTLIEKVISSGGSCMNEDTKVGTIKGLFPEGGVEG